MNTRPALVEHMSHKHEYIMKRFISEIGVVEHEFLKYRKSPPLTRNQPLFIGAIYWQRHLFEHLKKSVLVFKRMENDPAMKASYLMRTAFSQYFSLANDMNEYEKQQLADFLAKGTFVVNNIIKRNILKLNICGSPVGKRIKCISVVCQVLNCFLFQIKLLLKNQKKDLLRQKAHHPLTNSMYLIVTNIVRVDFLFKRLLRESQ